MNKILVVDSSAQNTDLLMQVLSSNGYETMSSESGHNALIKAIAFKPDLVILDVYLNDMSGFDVCKRIKFSPETQYVMVLCTSSAPSREVTNHAIQAGADDFMAKSFDPALLLIKVKSLLRVKDLSDQLKQNFIKMEETARLMEMQMKMAKQVQHSLIPDINFRFNGISIVSRYMPALDIGGDFYDVVELDRDNVAVIMGDVSGHGISAALLTGMMHSLIQGLVQKHPDPNELLSAANSEFYKIFENTQIGMYVCLFYMVIDTKNHVIHYSNAGQALPILVSSQDNSAAELFATGVPVGLMADSVYECKAVSYNKGDLLLVHTDGLADVFYKENPDAFVREIKKSLLDVYTLESEQEIIDILLSQFYRMNVRDDQKFELDDVSIVLCKM